MLSPREPGPVEKACTCLVQGHRPVASGLPFVLLQQPTRLPEGTLELTLEPGSKNYVPLQGWAAHPEASRGLGTPSLGCWLAQASHCQACPPEACGGLWAMEQVWVGVRGHLGPGGVWCAWVCWVLSSAGALTAVSMDFARMPNLWPRGSRLKKCSCHISKVMSVPRSGPTGHGAPWVVWPHGMRGRPQWTRAFLVP